MKKNNKIISEALHTTAACRLRRIRASAQIATCCRANVGFEL